MDTAWFCTQGALMCVFVSHAALQLCCSARLVPVATAGVQVDTALGGEDASEEARARAGDLLDRFCQYACSRENQVVNAATHFATGQMLVEAIQGALPRNHAITVRTRCVAAAGPVEQGFWTVFIPRRSGGDWKQ